MVCQVSVLVHVCTSLGTAPMAASDIQKNPSHTPSLPPPPHTVLRGVERPLWPLLHGRASCYPSHQHSEQALLTSAQLSQRLRAGGRGSMQRGHPRGHTGSLMGRSASCQNLFSEFINYSWPLRGQTSFQGRNACLRA